MFNTLAQFSRIAIGGLTMGIGTLVLLTPVKAETEVITDPKPLEIYTGTLQDLEGTESRNGVESLTVEGDNSDNVDIPSSEIDTNSLEAKTGRINMVLEDHDYNLGDTKRPSYQVPLLNF